jgi:RNA polymerase sigma-70 factor (ECF subfamily)
MAHLSKSSPAVTIPQTIHPRPGVGERTAKSGVNLDQLLTAVAVYRDREAFAQLFQLCSGKVHGLGMKIFHNEQQAKELVQDVMLTVWRKAPLFDSDRGSANTWIFAVARNRGFDMLRRRKAEPQCVSADDIWPLGEAPEAEIHGHEVANDFLELRTLRGHLEELPEAQREIVRMVYLEDKTHQEVAEELLIPLGTVKSRLRLAINKLRESLGGIQ